MALPVDVKSIDILKDFRAHLCHFGEDAKHALAAVEMEINRMVDWLTNDRRLYWQAEIRRRHDDLLQAKTELHRKRTSQMFGHDASLSEPRELLRIAKLRLEEAEQKLEKVKKWGPQLQQAILEYQSQARPLSDMIDGDLAHSLTLLDNMITALEEYTTSAPPSTDYVKQMKEQMRQSGAASFAAVAEGQRQDVAVESETENEPIATGPTTEDPKIDAAEGTSLSAESSSS